MQLVQSSAPSGSHDDPKSLSSAAAAVAIASAARTAVELVPAHQRPRGVGNGRLDRSGMIEGQGTGMRRIASGRRGRSRASARAYRRAGRRQAVRARAQRAGRRRVGRLRTPRTTAVQDAVVLEVDREAGVVPARDRRLADRGMRGSAGAPKRCLDAAHRSCRASASARRRWRRAHLAIDEDQFGARRGRRDGARGEQGEEGRQDQRAHKSSGQAGPI